MHKFMGPDGIYPMSAEGAGKCHCEATLNLWLIMATVISVKDWRRTSVSPAFKSKEDQGKYRPINLILIPGKTVEQLILETISRHMKDKEVLIRWILINIFECLKGRHKEDGARFSWVVPSERTRGNRHKHTENALSKDQAGGPAWVEGLDQITSRDPFQPQLCCDSGEVMAGFWDNMNKLYKDITAISFRSLNPC